MLEPVDHVPADSPAIVAEDRYWSDSAFQPTGRPLPGQSDTVPKLRKRKLQRGHHGLPVATIELAWIVPLSVQHRGRQFSSALLGLERKRGGRKNQNCESARPNDDRSVPMERTHNHSSPNFDAGLETHPPRPLSTGDIVPYQGEQMVKPCANVCQRFDS